MFKRITTLSMKSNRNNVQTQVFTASAPLPSPDNSEIKTIGKPYIFWGKDNLEPNLLNKMFYESAYQSGIIRAKVNYIIGSGFQVVEGDENSAILENNPSDYNLAEVMEDCTRDFELYNGFAICVYGSRGGNAAYIEHIDFDKLRFDLEMTKAFYSNDWGMSMQSEALTDYVEFDIFNPSINQEKSIFVYYEKPKNSSNKKSSKRIYYGIYPKPTYSGGIYSILADMEISKFIYFEAGNSFKGGTIINFANGAPDDDSKAKFEREVKEALTPSENAGGILLTYSNGKDREVTVTQINGNDLDKRYLMTEKAVGQNIIIAHGATSGMLFGIKTEGQLGGSTELEAAFNIFKKTYVRGRQKTLEQQFNYLFKNAYDSDLRIELNEPENIFTSIQQVDDGAGAVAEAEINEQFSKADPILEKLKTKGVPMSKLNFVEKVAIDKEDFDFDASEKTLMGKYKKENFMIFSPLQKQIMAMLFDGEDFQGIAMAIDEDLRTITKAYLDLKRKGIITDRGQLTAKGVSETINNDPNFVLETRYTYELRPGVEGPAILPDGRTRDFCETLINLGMAYTRQEIEEISQEVDRNVWLYRGGWYSDPKKPRPTPFCRHIWFQNITVQTT